MNPADIVDPNAPAEDDGSIDPSEIDDLMKTIPNKKANFFEMDSDMFAEIDGEIYQTDGLKFRVVTDETKKKISDALHKLHGTPTGPAPAPLYKRGDPLPDSVKQKISEGLKKLHPNGPAQKVNNISQRVGQQTQQKTAPKSQVVTKVAAPTRAGNLATRTDKAGNIKIKADGNPRQKLMAIRKYLQNAKDPKQHDAARKALQDLQTKLQPRIQKQSQRIDAQAAKSANKKGKNSRKGIKKGKKMKSTKIVEPKTTKATKPDANVSKRKAARVAKIAAKPVAKPTSQLLAKKPSPVAMPKKVVSNTQPKKPVVLKAHEHNNIDAAEYINLFNYQSIKAVQLQSMNLTFEEARLPDYLHVKQFAEPYTSWRPLTFAEQKVNFTPLKKALDAANAKLEVQLNAITADQKADLLSQIKRAVESNDIAAIGKIRVRYTGELSSALTEVQKQMFEYGMKSAAGELKVKIPPTAAEVKGAMRVQTDKLSQKMADDLTHAATGAVSQLATKNAGSITNTGTAEAIHAASEAMDGVIAKKGIIKTLSVIGTLNLGRATIFERYPEQVYAMQYSAIIDDRTTDLCLSLDGRVVKAGSDDFYNYSPPQHENCRSIFVEILQDEEFKPEIDGIPKSITSNTDLTQFEDLEAPIVKPNSPAIKVLKEELDDRQNKLKQYQDAGLYPNRQDTHQQRIDALKKIVDSSSNEDE